jgi:hypothetical protein
MIARLRSFLFKNVRILLYLLLIPPITLFAFCKFSSVTFGISPFNYHDGNPYNAAAVLFELSLFPFLLGIITGIPFFYSSLKSLPESIKTASPLVIFPYRRTVWSVLLAIYIAVLSVIVNDLFFEMPGGLVERLLELITLFLSTYLALLISFFSFSIFSSFKEAFLVALFCLLLSLLTSRVLIPLPAPVPWFSATYWTFKALATTNGLGSDIAKDDCWRFPENLLRTMSQADKEYYGCNCLGENLFDANSCDLPGIGLLERPKLVSSMPAAPDPPGFPPPDPLYPSPPILPDHENPTDFPTSTETLQQYQAEIRKIYKEYQLLWISYQVRVDRYREELKTYRTEKSLWEKERNETIDHAEGYIANFSEKLGWAFTDRDDSVSFWLTIGQSWLVTTLLILILRAALLLETVSQITP